MWGRERPWWCAFAGLALLAWSGAALGDEATMVVAAPCEEDGDRCMRGAVAFADEKALPIEWGFDTGWVPKSGPLAVQLHGHLHARTRLALAGELVTSWGVPELEPAALMLETPGTPESGLLGYHYGLDVGAKGKIDVGVGPVKLKWEGNLPFVPKIDFQVEAETTFDAWAFDPGVSLSDATAPVSLAQVDLVSLLGVPVPGFKGGFTLDVALDVEVDYVTDRLVIRHASGETVAGGVIEEASAASWAQYLGGPYVELDVHPEGTMTYDGVLHLMPTLFVEVLGNKWSLPVADVPVEVALTKEAWSLPPQRVRVPLPDLAVEVEEIDFGEVAVGSERFRSYALASYGEAPVKAAISTDDAAFVPYDATLSLDPDEAIEPGIVFAPVEAGDYEATLFVASNDPDAPLQVVLLRGTAVAASDVPDGSYAPPITVDSGCGCRVVASLPSSHHGALAAFACLALLGARRRRRSSAVGRG